MSYGVSLLHDKPYGSSLTWTLPVSTIFQGDYSLVEYLKCAYIAKFAWIVAISSTKLSILFLYMRLFTQLPKSRWIIRILFCIVICWAVIGVGEHYLQHSQSPTYDVTVRFPWVYSSASLFPPIGNFERKKPARCWYIPTGSILLRMLSLIYSY